ncbi:hypothetical protein C0J52_21402 [Blattella germanica]|nr:hypothetical protein C0J52_21402 [Blattella germanica]
MVLEIVQRNLKISRLLVDIMPNEWIKPQVPKPKFQPVLTFLISQEHIHVATTPSHCMICSPEKYKNHDERSTITHRCGMNSMVQQCNLIRPSHRSLKQIQQLHSIDTRWQCGVELMQPHKMCFVGQQMKNEDVLPCWITDAS